LLSPLAVRLLQLRDPARRDPECPANAPLNADLLTIVAAQTDQAPALMTTGADLASPWHTWVVIWPEKRDGPPAWKTLWKGWLRAQMLLEGVHKKDRAEAPCSRDRGGSAFLVPTSSATS
jgi:hypothetical protein